MKKTIKFLSLLVFSLFIFSKTSEMITMAEEKPSSPYDILVKEERFCDINSVLIGSGGYITGLVIHPEDNDIMYIRTDVGGCYRWEAETKSWTQLSMAFKLEGQYSVDGIALDPNNKDLVYICIGGNNVESSGVWKSENRGETWTEISPEDDIIFKGNSEHRGDGECIAVDPNNSNVLWVGTRGTGLYKTSDGGKTWEKVVLSDGKEEVRCVIYDSKDILDGKSKIVYALSIYEGLYKSEDGGKTFKKMEGIPEAPIYHEAHLDSEGRVLVTFGERRTQNLSEPSVRGVWRLNTDGAWENFGENLPDDGFTTYMSLEVDDNNPDRVLVGVGTGLVENSGDTYWKPPIYYTTDGGKTWVDVTPVHTDKMASEWKGNTHSSGCVGSLTFGEGDELWMTDWTEVYYTANVSAETDEGRAWRTYIENIEELVSFSAISLPNGKNDNLFTAADIKSAFAINDDEVDTYPSYPKEKGSFQQADYYAKDPNFVVGAYTSQSNDLASAEGTVYVSEDAGESWKALPNWDKKHHAGSIAISSEDKNKMVVATLDGETYYTSDGGTTWTKSETAPTGVLPGHIWHGSKPLESDKNAGNIFYMMSPEGLYKSEDYGVTWEITNLTPKMNKGESRIKVLTYEGAPGEVWISSSQGVWYSANNGDTFLRLGDLKGSISLGKGREDGNYALYFMGTLGSNEKAIYVSEDKAKSFTKLTDYNKYTLAKSSKIYASKNRFGRIYLGSSGLGWLYMDTAEEGYTDLSDISDGSSNPIGRIVAAAAGVLAIIGGIAFFIFRKKLLRK
ncbi:MAG: hypothetical protein J6K88_05340 [Oscillospiraceae bacterium]|nr:hypothetical protein [Oscillospiraceae bacterium]